MESAPLPSTLPILPLPHPLLLLPTARTTLFLSAPVGEALLHLLHARDPDLAQPILGAVPLLPHPPRDTQYKGHPSTNALVPYTKGAGADDNKTAPPTLCEYGVAARVVRLARASPQSLRLLGGGSGGSTAAHSAAPHVGGYSLTLHGLARIRLASPDASERALPKNCEANPAASLANRDVEYLASFSAGEQEGVDEALVEGFKIATHRLLDRLAAEGERPGKEVWERIRRVVDDARTDATREKGSVAWAADVLVAAIAQEYEDKLEYLCTPTLAARLQRATALCVKRTSILEVSSKVASDVAESLGRQQKEFYLRQQMAAIQKELAALNSSSPHGPVGDSAQGPAPPPASDLDTDEGADADELSALRARIEALVPGSEERKTAAREWKRMRRMQPSSVEAGVVRSYLEWLVALPWPTTQGDRAKENDEILGDPAFLQKARAQLDRDHYGLDKVKRRLIEYLAVVRLRAAAEREESARAQVGSDQGRIEEVKEGVHLVGGEVSSVSKEAPKRAQGGVKGPILLLTGPPGVGKTSLGASIARALGRPFARVSLGGVRDEAEIRGHRRTYVASGPGRIVQAIRRAGRSDMVMLLDEIDKVGQSSVHGDPSAALLEVLDPEQNHAFVDHYINVPLDLSRVLFVCTSNTLETIHPALLDRCEVVRLAGYTHAEKLAIARRFILPKQLAANGMDETRCVVDDACVGRVVDGWTREAGVRSLERAVGAVVRYKAVQWAETRDAGAAEKGGKRFEPKVGEWELETILGPSFGNVEEREREERPGLVYGLVVTGLGEGGIMPVETGLVPGSGRLKLTGSLGEVIKESAELALSWVKAHAYDLYVTKARGQDPLKQGMDAVDVHMHLPAGAQRKDGPSAGVAMVCALVSLLTGLCVPTSIAMTGEITLRGRVAPVGGVKEKVLGAHRAQVTKVIVPWANRREVEHEVAPEVRKEVAFVFVRSVEEALEAAFGPQLRWRTQTQHVMLESRL